MMDHEDPMQPIANDGADHKKNEDEPKVKAPTSNQPTKTLEERAKEFYVYVVETAKHTDKRTILLTKQKLEARAKEFFRHVVTYMKEKAGPDLLLTKQRMELKAKAFAASIVEMVKTMNKDKMLMYKQAIQLKSREMIFLAVKTMKTTNYRRMLKKEFRQEMVHKHGRVMLAMMGMLMLIGVAFHNDGSLEEAEFFESGVRGRSLAALEPVIPTPTSFEPAEHSLHPKWRLWHDIPEDQQDRALEELVPYFEKYGWLIGTSFNKAHIPKEQICDFLEGSPSDICMVPELTECSFLSIGCTGKADFENILANKMQCKGFAVDPVESKESRLNPIVSFQNYGLSKLHEPEGEKPKKTLWNATVPSLRKFLHEENTDILKLHCEGCEIALMRDILVEDPSFFHHFGQVYVQKYSSKQIVQNEEDLYYFGLMFPLLEEAGHTLVKSRVRGGKPKYDRGECLPEFAEWGYHCGVKPEKKKAGKSNSLVEFLFAKEEIAYKQEGLPASTN